MRPLLFVLLSLVVSSTQAFDSTFHSSIRASYVTTEMSRAPFDDKIVLNAREDAAMFIATDGKVRGAHLDAALQWLRDNHPRMHDASDEALASALLAQ